MSGALGTSFPHHLQYIQTNSHPKYGYYQEELIKRFLMHDLVIYYRLLC
uniref:Uncharacterized protein n=1 Tax=Arundo donax TaxID=35708 RepID=A0A0A9H2U9_ARUDO